MTQNAVSRGMRVFVIVWLGQLVSLVGSGLTSFALGLWVYRHTGSVTQFAFIGCHVFSVGRTAATVGAALRE
jgi:DHA3 family macrolide efflux protein-like MFS transporter